MSEWLVSGAIKTHLSMGFYGLPLWHLKIISNIKDHWSWVTITNKMIMKMFEILQELPKCDRDIMWENTAVKATLTDLHRSVRVVTNLQSVKKKSSMPVVDIQYAVNILYPRLETSNHSKPWYLGEKRTTRESGMRLQAVFLQENQYLRFSQPVCSWFTQENVQDA